MGPQETSPRQRYQFGNYEIAETLGAGGMGIVYRATDVALGRTVALKILRDDLRSQPHIVARFQREAEAIAALDHPNIVHVHNVGRIGKIPFIAMEHIEGHTLGDVLRDGERIQWRDALALGRQIANALAAAHAMQIIHRDIKPGNILLDHAGKAYVTDFGIAKILTSASRLTVDGSRLGTPQYMCPERCRNRSITPASDLYSLGVVLFQAIAGQLPHEANSNVELIRKITGEAPVRLRSLVPEVPDEVERFIAYLLERDPRNRPQHATELVAAIDRLIEGKPLDEHYDHAMEAIAAYRGEMATPTPAPSASGSESLDRDPLRVRIREGWFALPVRSRIALAISAAGLVCLPLALGGMALLKAPVLRLPDYGPDLGLDRWTALEPLARSRQEAPGITVITPSLDGFEIASLVSAADAGTVMMRFAEEGGDRQTVLALDTRTGLISMVMPLRSVSAASAFQILGTVPNDPGRWIAATADGVFAVSRSDDTDAHELWDTAASAWAATGTAGDLLLAAPRGDGGSNLVQRRAAYPDAPELLAETAGTIVWTGVNAAGTTAYFAEQRNEGLRLWRLALDGHAPAAEAILDGIRALGAQPLDPAHDQLVVERNPGRVEIVDGYNGRIIDRLGEGYRPSWQRDGSAVVVTAKDHAGRRQLYAIATADHARSQLTHVDAGVQDAFVITGHHAVTAMATGDALVLVAL